ncbi:MAG: hypothetical protein HYS23_12615 [Geobacter sp.]|nr:hypothetical protein [Geobacter sp.]
MKKTIWYRLTLNSAEVAAGEVEKRKAAFDEAFTAARAPRMMALFQQSRQDGGIDLFLTPECIDDAPQLIDEWGCTPCDRPSMAGLFLLVGHNEMTYYMP